VKSENERIKGQQEKSGNIQKNLDAAADKQREMNKTINCIAIADATWVCPTVRRPNDFAK